MSSFNIVLVPLISLCILVQPLKAKENPFVGGKAADEVVSPTDLSWTHEMPPGYILMIVDVSCSMTGRVEQVRNDVLSSLNSLSDSWKFNVVTFSDSIKVMSERGWYMKREEHIHIAMDMLRREKFGSTTDISRSLEFASPLKPDFPVPFVVIIFSDFDLAHEEEVRVLYIVEEVWPSTKKILAIGYGWNAFAQKLRKEIINRAEEGIFRWGSSTKHE